MKYLIDNFGATNLFGREMYEYYSRITGRILKVDNEWIYAFRYPPETTASREEILEAQERLLQQEADIWGLAYNLRAVSMQEESRSTLGLVHVSELTATMAVSSTSAADLSQPGPSGIGRTLTGAALKESHTRLSVSLEESELFKTTSSSSSTSTTTSSSSSSSSSAAAAAAAAAAAGRHKRITLEELKAINRYAESTKSLSYLPQVHERQTARMRTRSEWFLSVSPTPPRLLMVPIEFEERCGNGGASAVATSSMAMAALRSESIKHRHAKEVTMTTMTTTSHHGNHAKIPVRRTSSKEKKLLRRNSSKSKKDKENGNKSVSVEALHGGGVIEKNGNGGGGAQVSLSSPSRVQSLTRSVPELDCPESDIQQLSIPVTLAYKPRI